MSKNNRSFDKREGVMVDSLRQVRGSIETVQRPARQPRHQNRHEKPQWALCHPSDLGADGDDHINISPLAETHIGVFLHPTSHTHFSIPFAPGGGFASITAYSNFLSDPAKKPSLKGEYGNRALSTTRELHKVWVKIPQSQKTPIKHFKFRLARATWIKIKSYPEYCKQIAESTLPFRMYGWNEDKSSRVSAYDEKFWIDVLEEIRNTLKRGTNATPNFDFVIPGSTTQAMINEIETKQNISVRTEPLDLGINNPVKKRKPRPEIKPDGETPVVASQEATSSEVVQSSVVEDSVLVPAETHHVNPDDLEPFRNTPDPTAPDGVEANQNDQPVECASRSDE